MELTGFSYHFSVQGRKAGYFNLDFDFAPRPGTGESMEDAFKRGFKRLERLLDAVLLNGREWTFQKTPTFKDSTYSTAVGYSYEGTFRKRTLPWIRSLLVPGLAVSDGENDPYAHLSCSLAGQHEKSRGSAKLNLSLTLRYRLNCMLLERILALPGLSVSPEADEELKKFQAILAAYREDPGKLLEFWSG